MKKTVIDKHLISLIKLFYIIAILLSLCLLKACIASICYEDEYFSYSLIDKFCKDLAVFNIFLTGSSLMFIGLF